MVKDMGFAAALESVVANHAGASYLRSSITSHAERLNATATAAQDASPEDRASAVCTILKAVFGAQVVADEASDYTQKTQANW